MRELTADLLVGRWSTGGSTRLRAAGRSRRRGRRGVRPPRRPDPAGPGPPRGGGRPHGRRLRQGDRADRGLPGHLRPGALRVLGGLYDAKLDHQPVLAITESQEIRLLGTSFKQELALETAFDDVADYNVRVNVPVQIPAVVDIGIGHALARGTVSHITFPPGLEDTAAETSPWMLMPTGTRPPPRCSRPVPGCRPRPTCAGPPRCSTRGRVALLVGAGGLEAGGAAGGGRRRGRAGGQVPARQGGRARRPPADHRLHRRARDPAPPRRPWRAPTPCCWSGPASPGRPTCPTRPASGPSRSRPTRPASAAPGHRGHPARGRRRDPGGAAAAAVAPGRPRVPGVGPGRHGQLAATPGRNDRPATSSSPST